MQRFDNQRIVITSANSLTGIALLPALKARGATTIALIRQPRDLAGADQIMTDWMHAPEAVRALEAADVIVHLSGDIMARGRAGYEAAQVATTRRVVDALKTGRARRVITLSYTGSDPRSRNDYLRTNGEREQMLINSGTETVVFRCPALINAPSDPGPMEEALTSQEGKPVQMIGSGSQRWRPLYRPDVVQAILAAISGGAPGVYDLTGPDEMTANELIRLLNRRADQPISNMPGWISRIASRFIPDLTPQYVDVALRDANPDPSRVVQTFGLQLTSLKTVWG